MAISIQLIKQSDLWGSTASALCLAHCLSTPFLFAVHASSIHGNTNSPVWWGVLDILFIAISFLAVFWSVKNTSKNWMKYALWISWTLLSAIIINEKIHVVALAEALIYVPSIALVVLHLYNRSYCQCADKSCCIHSHLNTKDER